MNIIEGQTVTLTESFFEWHPLAAQWAEPGARVEVFAAPKSWRTDYIVRLSNGIKYAARAQDIAPVDENTTPDAQISLTLQQIGTQWYFVAPQEDAALQYLSVKQGEDLFRVAHPDVLYHGCTLDWGTNQPQETHMPLSMYRALRDKDAHEAFVARNTALYEGSFKPWKPRVTGRVG